MRSPGCRPRVDDYHVFHSGTALDGDHVVATGGRVLCVAALGHNVKTAQRRAYEIAEPSALTACRCAATSAIARRKTSGAKARARHPGKRVLE